MDLSDVAVDAIERLAALAARNHVKLETGDLPEARVLGDRQSLLQMVSNLIENAIKYTEGNDKQAHGGEIHVESTPGGGSWFEVRFGALE